MSEILGRFVDDTWLMAVNVGPEVGRFRVLVYEDGDIGFEHRCDRGERGIIVCAPLLQLSNGGHRVEQKDPLTISPSISCPDCGTHGYVRDGAWVPA